MTLAPTCPRCGAQLPLDHDAQRPCARCLLRVGLDASSGESSGARVPAPALAELQPHFPRLELLALVGEGGMGAVYKARDRELDRLVAVKILTVTSTEGAQFDERFAREARAMARLSHPNIAAVFDHGKAGPWSYLVLEYVDGENLRRVLRSRSIGPAEALRWVGEICAALQYAHENGVVHRDIKPENVLVDAAGRVKVVDFGLAKLLDRRPGEATLTGTQQSLGTWHYMAPEQYEKPQSVDHRADIYSLGVVLYELLTGQVPVGRFDLPSQKIQVDVRVDEVVLKTLAREPERRYQAIHEVKSRVDDIGRGPQRSSAANERTPVGSSTSTSPRTVWMWVAGVLGVGAIALAVFVFALAFFFAPMQEDSVLGESGFLPMLARSISLETSIGAISVILLGVLALTVALAHGRSARTAARGTASSSTRSVGKTLAVTAAVLGGFVLLAVIGVTLSMLFLGVQDAPSPQGSLIYAIPELSAPPIGSDPAADVRVPALELRWKSLSGPAALVLLLSAAIAAVPLVWPRPAGAAPRSLARTVLLAALPLGMLMLGAACMWAQTGVIAAHVGTEPPTVLTPAESFLASAAPSIYVALMIAPFVVLAVFIASRMRARASMRRASSAARG